MGFWEKLKQEFGNFWKEVDPGTKLIVIFASIVLVLVVGYAVSLHLQPHYTPLYNNLSLSSAAEILRQLDDNYIDYQLKNEGRDIYVLKAEANRVRLILKNKGLPKSEDGLGYELLDMKKLGKTDLEQRIDNKRALEGELVQTIKKIQGVQAADVKLVIPEPTLFEKDEKEATASIRLTLSSEGILSNEQVKGIQQLVASAVPGLKAKYVTIIDQTGSILAAPVEDEEGIGMMTTRMGIQKNVESYYIRKVQGMLDSVVGFNNSVVRVDSLLDFDKIEETEEKYDPESAVVRNEVITSERSSGSSNLAKGPPGVESNMVPGNKAGNASSQENQSNKEVINNKYEIDKRIRHIIKGVGDIKKLTVSVFLEQKIKTDDKGNKTPEPRTQEEINTFTEIVKNAIGFDEKRGDKVIIKEILFEKKQNLSETAPAPAPSLSPTLLDLVKEWVPPLFKMLIGIAVIAVFFMISRRKETESQVEYTPQQGKSEDSSVNPQEVLKAFQNEGLKAVEKRAFIDAEVGKLVDQSPVETERILKSWIKE